MFSAQLPETENVPFAGKWQGREEVGQFFSKVFELQDIVEFEPEEFIAQGDKVVVLGRFSMRIKANLSMGGSDLRLRGRCRRGLRSGAETWGKAARAA